MKKLKRSLLVKFESKIFVVEVAHNLDEMAFDEFVGILQAFELSKVYGDKDKKKDKDKETEDPIGVVLKFSPSEDPMTMLV